MVRRSAFLLIGVIAFAALLAGLVDWPTAEAQDNRSIDVEVAFFLDGFEDGTPCGLDNRLTSDFDPGSHQVIITAASGDIVGKVDLYNALSVDPPSDSDRPGTMELGVCFVRASIEVPDSPFYTFSIRNEFEWTMSRSELEARDWLMPVWFTPEES